MAECLIVGVQTSFFAPIALKDGDIQIVSQYGLETYKGITY